MLSMRNIKQLCPACLGKETGGSIPCPDCGGLGCPVCGDGFIEDLVCGRCNGKKYIDFGSLSEEFATKINDLSDKVDGIMDKCNDIFEKVNE